MAFSEKIKKEIEMYCNNHLATDSWYENEFYFIQDAELKNRIIIEFKAIRFAYKLYEGIGATDANLMFEVRNQILAYASIYEAVIENVLTTYYFNTNEFDSLLHHTIPIRYLFLKIRRSDYMMHYHMMEKKLFHFIMQEGKNKSLGSVK